MISSVQNQSQNLFWGIWDKFIVKSQALDIFDI